MVEKTLPPCAKLNYDCSNCPKPQVPQNGHNDLAPCDGKATLYFCRFATANTASPACPKYNLQNYACTHGGGNCRPRNTQGRRWNNMSKKGKFWPQIRAQIWQKAEDLFMQDQMHHWDLPITPERCELREGGYYDKAKLIVLRELSRGN